MPTSSPPPPNSNTDRTSSNDSEEQVDSAVWKRRYLALQEIVNMEKVSKKKSQYVILTKLYNLCGAGSVYSGIC